ncbi:MAG: hemolysin family protein, partial [Gemmatimonadales bacterium]
MDDPSSTGSILIGLASIIILVLANAFFVGAEFSLVGARRTRLEELARHGYTGAAAALRAVKHLDRYISATQLGITLASLGLGWIGEPALAGLIDQGFSWLPDPLDSIATHGVAVAIAFTTITVLHIILGELVPKSLALLHPEKLSAWLAFPLTGFAWVMAGPIYVLNGTANALLRRLGIKPPQEHERVHSPEEIRMLVEQSEVSGSMGGE